ncbi:Forkhead box protein E4, partial [Pterocles gutturalis]
APTAPYPNALCSPSYGPQLSSTVFHPYASGAAPPAQHPRMFSIDSLISGQQALQPSPPAELGHPSLGLTWLPSAPLATLSLPASRHSPPQLYGAPNRLALPAMRPPACAEHSEQLLGLSASPLSQFGSSNAYMRQPNFPASLERYM